MRILLQRAIDRMYLGENGTWNRNILNAKDLKTSDVAINNANLYDLENYRIIYDFSIDFGHTRLNISIDSLNGRQLRGRTENASLEG